MHTAATMIHTYNCCRNGKYRGCGVLGVHRSNPLLGSGQAALSILSMVAALVVVSNAGLPICRGRESRVVEIHEEYVGRWTQGNMRGAPSISGCRHATRNVNTATEDRRVTIAPLAHMPALPCSRYPPNQPIRVRVLVRVRSIFLRNESHSRTRNPSVLFCLNAWLGYV